MKIIAKQDAMRMRAPGDGTRLIKYDCGKYDTSIDDCIGKRVRQFDGIIAVYAERRTDQDGAYTQLMCVQKPNA